ncbi:MAG: hypothetical protein MJ105_03455 [Lachnospiraceae bacterium]|nr:hypothetical protein [Lachnospiraceae bacterium]
MYSVVNIVNYPGAEDPEMLSVEIYDSFADAHKRSEEIIEIFLEDFGEDYIEHATQKKPLAIMFNGDVTEYAYIVEIKNV